MNRQNVQSVFLTISIAVIMAVLFSACKNSVEPSDAGWRLVWQDEFNGLPGTLPDSTRWTIETGTDWGNAQLEFDTNRPENVSHDSLGNLVITARKEAYRGSSYTSARITTKGKYSFTYGKVEARIKLPWGQGIWPAFWMLGANSDTVIWPECGEIDILELRGQMPGRINGSLHGPGYSGSKAATKPFDLTNDRFDAGYHTFAVEWGVGYVKYFVDNILYQTVASADVSGQWVFDHNFNIILNLAVGGNYVGAPGTGTIFPQTMLIDYVRVYEAKP